MLGSSFTSLVNLRTLELIPCDAPLLCALAPALSCMQLMHLALEVTMRAPGQRPLAHGLQAIASQGSALGHLQFLHCGLLQCEEGVVPAVTDVLRCCTALTALLLSAQGQEQELGAADLKLTTGLLMVRHLNNPMSGCTLCMHSDLARNRVLLAAKTCIVRYRHTSCGVAVGTWLCAAAF